MVDSYEFVTAQLNRLPSDRGFVVRGDNGWIRCPYHSNGQESTPSMMINLKRKVTSKGTFNIGSARCHACGKFIPNWNILAKKLSLASDVNQPEDYSNPFDDEMDRAVLNESNLYLPNLDNMIPWNPEENWRTVKGGLLVKVGAKIMFNEKIETTQLYLPCYVNKKHVGGVQANLKKQGKRNYFNTPGEWTRDLGLYPYDYIKKRLKIRKVRTVVLVEGGRDSLKSIQYSIPALGILGTGNWSDAKADLLLSLDLKRVIIAFDPDAAGEKATKTVYKSLKDEVDVRRFSFPPDIDPGNMSAAIAARLRKHII